MHTLNMVSYSLLPVKPFADSLWKQINDQLDKACLEIPKPWIAAFDADGTLWDTDVGESFFDYQISQCDLDLPKGPWDHYLQMKIMHAPTAYLWLAQINQGKSLKQVRQWSDEWFSKQKDFPIFQSQKKLIELLRSKGFEIYVVSASVKWCVESAAAALGISQAHALGVACTVQNGLITKESDGPITWREGKVEALLKATGGVKPILGCGNTLGDLALIESASHIRLSVSSRNSLVKDAEDQLREVAIKQGFLTHDF
jgi:phosphoserine phosphatase